MSWCPFCLILINGITKHGVYLETHIKTWCVSKWTMQYRVLTPVCWHHLDVLQFHSVLMLTTVVRVTLQVKGQGPQRLPWPQMRAAGGVLRLPALLSDLTPNSEGPTTFLQVWSFARMTERTQESSILGSTVLLERTQTNSWVRRNAGRGLDEGWVQELLNLCGKGVPPFRDRDLLRNQKAPRASVSWATAVSSRRRGLLNHWPRDRT